MVVMGYYNCYRLKEERGRFWYGGNHGLVEKIGRERERVGGGSPYGVVLVGANGDQICFLWKRGLIGWLSF